MSRIAVFTPFFLAAVLAAPAQDFQQLQTEITDFTLPNGMRFLVAERHDSPAISVRVYVKAGSVDDPAGSSGLASMFERLALLGAENTGSRNAAAEKKALDSVEEIRDRLDAETAKGPAADEVKLATIRLELGKAQTAALLEADPGELSRALQQNGIGWSISAGTDSTTLDFSVPSNRAELWFLLESQELHHPVFRRFYDQRDDLVSTYRQRVESSAVTTVLNALAEAAFSAHPYGKPVAGWPSDLATLRLSEARQFFNRYWGPGNIVVAIAGDIAAADARRLAEKYFGPIPARPSPAPVHTQEPDQRGSRTVALENAARPMLAVGYKRPDQLDRDDAALEIARQILGGGREGWLGKELGEDKHLATGVVIRRTYPGARYPHLFTILVTLAPGHTAAETEKALTTVIGRLQAAPVDEATLARARAMAVGDLCASLADNAGIASSLARAAGEYGDWRKLFALADALDKVTATQVQTVALKYLTPTRRTSVHMDAPVAAAQPARGASK